MASAFDVGGSLGGGLLDDVLSFLGDNNGFKAGFILELVDLRKDRAEDAVVFVINPLRYELSEPFQMELSPTEDDTVIAEENGIIVRDIILEGTFGVRNKTASGWDPVQLGGASKSGTEHHKALQDLFRKYSDKKKTAEGVFYVMVLHVLNDDDHFRVIPGNFTTPRDARRNRMHKEYRMTLTAIEGPNYRKPKKQEAKDDYGFFDAVTDISNALGDLRAGFAEVTANISAIKRKIGNINALMIQVGGVISAVGNAIRAFRDLAIVFPMQLMAQISLQVERASDVFVNDIAPSTREQDEAERLIARSMKSMSQAMDNILMYAEQFASPSSDPRESTKAYRGEAALTRDDIDNQRGGADIGSRTRVVQGSGRSGGLSLGNLAGSQVVIIVRGDSILSLAHKYSVVPEMIVLLNDLRFPYISEAGGPGILKPGDKILIPLSTAPPAGEVSGPSLDQYVSAEDALYGVDLALDKDALNNEDRMELKVDKAHGSVDAEKVRGIANVVQGVEIIINTELTASQHVPDVGRRRSIGGKGTLRHALMTAQNLRDGVLDDPRIEEIEQITTILDGDELRQQMRARLVTGRTLPLGLPFGRTSGAGSTANR
jgi:hypothetical protein